MLRRPGCSWALNDNALCPEGRDWLGMFHGAKRSDWNGGTSNAVFVDALVEEVRSGLQTIDNQADYSNAEGERLEKYGWPFKARLP